MSAGPFNPLSWEMDTLNWVPDVRMPMFAAQSTGRIVRSIATGMTCCALFVAAPS
jgi:hypothetical protein